MRRTRLLKNMSRENEDQPTQRTSFVSLQPKASIQNKKQSHLSETSNIKRGQNLNVPSRHKETKTITAPEKLKEPQVKTRRPFPLADPFKHKSKAIASLSLPEPISNPVFALKNLKEPPDASRSSFFSNINYRAYYNRLQKSNFPSMLSENEASSVFHKNQRPLRSEYFSMARSMEKEITQQIPLNLSSSASDGLEEWDKDKRNMSFSAYESILFFEKSRVCLNQSELN